MYSLEELEAMAPAEIVAIAEGMGMKKAAGADPQEVRYYILDNQASATAKEEASKVASRMNSGKKRGRKSKSAATQEASAETVDNTETIIAQEPKKRGRKPKNAMVEEPQEGEDKANNAVVAAEAIDEAATQPAPKKRGRKSKAELIAMNDGEEKGRNEAPQEEEKAVSSNQREAADAQVSLDENSTASADRRKNGNSTFDSFFGKSKGRTFTPRGQQNGEETAQPLPPNRQLPRQQELKQNVEIRKEQRQKQEERPQNFVQRPQQITLQEPGANSQTPKNQQKQKNKKGQFGRQQEIDTRFPAAALEGKITVYGVLEVMPEGFGFLRSSDFNYLPSPDDVYVSQQQIKQYGLRMGDVVQASIRLPLPEEKYYAMVKPISINGLDPVQIRDRAKFEHLVPLFPDEKFEITKGKSANISTRIVDMFAPIGKGQRALIVAPPKTGKTILLKDIANAISENHPETYIIMLLIDERPEEVTDMARSVNAEVIASTFDEPADRHVRIAGIVLEKAKRLVESGHDVVIMLDSITRLARAYNTVSPASGKILSGGVDANALQRPKRFFGAARNIEGGGSLTIIATALTETSSKMDEVIFEEFKGTGNMELQLDRKLSNKRIFPAVDIVSSSTRRDDLLLPEETLNRMWVLRNYLGDMNSLEAMEFMKKRMEMTRSNEELLVTMDR